MWGDDPQYVAERDGYSYMHEGRKGEGVKPIKSQQLTIETKKTCDFEYLKRSTDFMQRAVKADKPFYLYFNHSLMHFPMVTRPEFVGKSKNGEWGDCLLMLDHDFGVLLDKVDELGVRNDTIVILCGDNGAEDLRRSRYGGFFGAHFSSAEGGIRTPLIRSEPCPGRRRNNEMVHVTDMFTTLLKSPAARPQGTASSTARTGRRSSSANKTTRTARTAWCGSRTSCTPSSGSTSRSTSSDSSTSTIPNGGAAPPVLPT
jgi:arylsulfatase